MDVQAYWQKFLEEKKLPLETRYFEAFYFGSDEKSANHLLNLVLDGEKTATSSAQEEYVLNNEREPKVNDYSIVTDFKGQPRCVIQTREVMKLPFEEMTYELCKFEGEDLTLKTWQDKHIDFFNIVGKQTGYHFQWDMIVIFEKFDVVYK